MFGLYDLLSMEPGFVGFVALVGDIRRVALCNLVDRLPKAIGTVTGCNNLPANCLDASSLVCRLVAVR